MHKKSSSRAFPAVLTLWGFADEDSSCENDVVFGVFLRLEQLAPLKNTVRTSLNFRTDTSWDSPPVIHRRLRIRGVRLQSNDSQRAIWLIFARVSAASIP